MNNDPADILRTDFNTSVECAETQNIASLQPNYHIMQSIDLQFNEFESFNGFACAKQRRLKPTLH